ncbi:DNA-directed RNA polymerase II subunit rpb2-like [Schistocerca gregaria]|uniref:DNA-directed RNA polymerase II subunit rpb2-like n=1 Tax=Schistocerca gregaria TaxID=7010 RepID=UPI00211DDA74|nr:DNA-directed RNA polymerase II subunit rpb2-like [Schistocerca gregaria]
MVPIGRIPTMVRSRICNLNKTGAGNLSSAAECDYDEGGYFIVNGSEKVLIAQEKMSNNHIYVFKQPKESKYTWIAEVRSVVEGSFRPPSATYVRLLQASKTHDATIQATLTSSTRDDVPIIIVFRAFGFESDKDILEHICYDLEDERMVELIKPSLVEGREIRTRDTALEWIGTTNTTFQSISQSRLRFAEEVLQKEVLPHVSQHEGGNTQKAFYFGYMVHRLLQAALERRPPDDRDHYGNKRMELAGALMEGLFCQLFVNMVKQLKKKFLAVVDNEKTRVFDFKHYISGEIITTGLNYSLSTGNWGAGRRGAKTKSGVSQVLNRLTFLSTLSHLRRLNTPIGSDSKLAKPRQLHNTHWGMVCPAETPEGHQCGLVKNLSLMALISVAYQGNEIEPMLRSANLLDSLAQVAPSQILKSTKIFLDGAWLGMSSTAPEFVEYLKSWRRQRFEASQISITHDIEHREVHIQTDPGRCCRPLFVVHDNFLQIKKSHIQELQDPHSGVNWNTILEAGLVDIVDTAEEETLMIAMVPADLQVAREAYIKCEGFSQSFTHCEIHPSMILGVVASVIPFPDHNQSPRNTYQSAMGKQALGVYATNFNLRMDSLAHVLWYPQKPLARPHAVKYLKFRDLPAGTNVVVAIACYSGYNQEDSVMLNQSSIDRGLFRSVFYRTYREEESCHEAHDSKIVETFEKPTPGEVGRISNKNYSRLDEDGIVSPGTPVFGEDIIIGRTRTVPDGIRVGDKEYFKEDSSKPSRPSESGIVDQVMISTSAEGNRFVKVRIRSIRTPTIGDKFSSRHGQKGTCGMLYRQEDMPFNRDGICPDLIMNPHAIPSRMTIGHMIECLLSKLAAVSGEEGDATPFTDVNVEQISQRLHSYGYQPRGNEVVYHGHTGRRMEAQLFMGPMYYQRLKHLVEDKMFSRARGRTQILTHQPAEGRSRGGGLRFGEMERDVMIAHGSSQFLKERLLYQSDIYRLHICEVCGLIAITTLESNRLYCKNCKLSSRIVQVLLPYACKLLFQELMSMNIAPRISTVPPPPAGAEIDMTKYDYD